MTSTLFSVPVEFFLFGATLLAVAVFHHHSLRVALVGLAAIVAFKFFVSGFEEGRGLEGLGAHFVHEAHTLANLALLLTAFELIARHFELSRVPDIAPNYLPNGVTGAFVFLAVVFVLSAFLDNIACGKDLGDEAEQLQSDAQLAGAWDSMPSTWSPSRLWAGQACASRIRRASIRVSISRAWRRRS